MDLEFTEDMVARPGKDLNTTIYKLQQTGAFKTEKSKEALTAFSNSVKNRFQSINSIVCQDLNNGEKISITNHSLDAKSQDILDRYAENLDTLNVDKHILKELDTLTATVPSEFTKRITDLILTWHQTFLITWDNRLETRLLDQINKKHKIKCQQQFGIYNFTNTTIPDKDFNLLKNGKKIVIPTFLHSRLKVTRIKSEVIDYCTRYRKYFENNKSPVPSDCTPEEWLSMAETTATSEEAHNFYASVGKNISLLELSLPDSKTNNKEAKFAET